jgi:integrase
MMRLKGLTIMSAPQQIESSIKAKIRSLPIELWPEADRKAWMCACQPSQRLKRGGAGSHMKPITLNDLARRYGYFLDYINRRGLLDMNKAAGAHVTPESVDAYLQELTARVGSVTVQGSICKLRRACELIDLAADLSWLADIEKDLALVMRPRSKSDRWVLTEVLVEAGLTLITEAENSRKMSKRSQARQVRNGLMVGIVLSASETKEDRPDERRIDDLLQPALDRYLKKYRPLLAGADQSTVAALWLSSNDGKPMTYDGVARAITETTRATVGVAVSPHLFRTSVASSAAIHGGAKPHLASALLHHTDHGVTEAHYNRASSLSAAKSFREIIQGYVKD